MTTDSERFAASNRGGEPFLSVLCVIDESDLMMLEDVLTCLDSQTVQQFELVLLGWGFDVLNAERLREAVDRHRFGLRDRTRILVGSKIDPDRIGDLRLLKTGIAETRGTYVAMIDGRTLVFGRWVEEFMELAKQAPGSVLRSVSTDQEFIFQEWPGGRFGFAPIDGPSVPRIELFDAVTYFASTGAALGSFAIPRGTLASIAECYLDLPLGWPTEVFFRAALLCGVSDSDAPITSLRRLGIVSRGEDTDSLRPQLEMQEVVKRLDAEPLVFPPHSVSAVLSLSATNSELRARIRDQEIERDALNIRCELLSRTVGELRASAHDGATEVARLQAELSAVLTSTSWRISAPFRGVTGFVKRLAAKRSTTHRKDA